MAVSCGLGADCKSARASVRWFESSPLHHCSDLAKALAERTESTVAYQLNLAESSDLT